MKHGIFYILPQALQKNNTFKYFTENFFCKLISEQWRSNKSILITCDTKEQAIKINQALWIYDNNTFLPHDLFEKNNKHTPILIYWREHYYDYQSRDILVNLMKKNMRFFFNFNEIIDFVPITNTLKVWARNRYKSYKKHGFKLNIIHVPIHE
ncbi:DNA polymerase III subunit chi [Candidatus Blochmannia ocreatus (nom. nud.)]|uniref:DNA polymerase III subunit chi n=1 Tax=Candidatus Blochmannia ocreatus (nom. nud.) TaxID=251538 RepID=A0ABY4SVU7_9ENTR|nr:DNA polymerase III subunit chi [Candidatus Blochmannia ocreatus]URJ25125.1 DNA polymerase III subunit chi [Candidatus Blochmannia ocreatus]